MSCSESPNRTDHCDIYWRQHPYIPLCSCHVKFIEIVCFSQHTGLITSWKNLATPFNQCHLIHFMKYKSKPELGHIQMTVLIIETDISNCYQFSISRTDPFELCYRY